MTIAYPDVSNHNGPMPLQDKTVACFAKSSEGTGYTDPYYLHYKAEAERVHALFGAYHFLTQGNAAAQARFAYSIVGPDVPMMIDFEPEYDAKGNPVSQPSLTDAVAFRDTYRQLGGNIRLVYLPHWYWSGHLGSPSLAPLADLALVSSEYTTYSDTGPGWAPYGGTQPAVWQYTDQLPYSGQKVDFNAYRGTVDDFAALLGLAGADMDANQANQLQQLYNAVFYGGDSMGQAAPGEASNGIADTLDFLGKQATAQADLAGKLDALSAAVAKLTAPVPAQVDLAALETLIEQHLATGSVPSVIAAAVLQHLSTATANAKP